MMGTLPDRLFSRAALARLAIQRFGEFANTASITVSAVIPVQCLASPHRQHALPIAGAANFSASPKATK